MDLNGYSAGRITYQTDDEGEVTVFNNGSPSTIASIIVTAPDATFNLGNNITVAGETLVNNVAIGTFNTQATHNDTIVIKDTDGGSVTFTGATVNNGIEVKPDENATESLIIRGEKPVSSDGGNAIVKILGESPDVTLEGEAQSIIIEAENSTFHLDETGNAESITISDNAKGSTITASKYYEFELMFNEGDKVEDIVTSNLFGYELIRVVGYPSENESINDAYLLKLDGEFFSHVYTFENVKLEADYITAEEGKFQVDKENMVVYLDGKVKGTELRQYLEDQSQELFNINPEWGKVVISFYDVKNNDVQLYPSDTIVDGEYVWDPNSMRVLVGTNEQHGLYILTKNTTK